jgi:hypothetical protein
MREVQQCSVELKWFNGTAPALAQLTIVPGLSFFFPLSFFIFFSKDASLFFPIVDLRDLLQ